MVVEEGQPALGFTLVVVTLQPMQISGYGRLRNLEAQLEQFAMNTRCTPTGIVLLHAPHQLADLLADLRSSRPAEPRPQSPKQSKARAMPGHYRLRFHHDQGLGPAQPQMAERNPEQPIEAPQLGTALLPLEHGELLPKCERFQSEVVARHEEGADVGDHRESEHNHQSDLSWTESPGRAILEANA